MNWRDIEWNIATLGRLAGLGIILAGVVLAMLDASAFNLSRASQAGSHFRFRYFLGESTGFLWKGGLVFAAAEVADRFGWGGRRSIDWHGTRFLRVLGVTVATIGIGLAVWNVDALTDIKVSPVIRVMVHGVIDSLWSGGVLILAAELADRIGWRGGDAQKTAELPA